MEPNLTDKLKQLLQTKQIPFEEIEHPPATSCQESALYRGTPLEIGGKTLLFKDKKDFHLFTLSAALEVDSNQVRKILKSQRLRFATPEELWELAQVEKGALPPFGRDLLPFDLYLDTSLLKNDRIAFNAGSLTLSFILKTEDYLKLVRPIICSFSKK